MTEVQKNLLIRIGLFILIIFALITQFSDAYILFKSPLKKRHEQNETFNAEFYPLFTLFLHFPPFYSTLMPDTQTVDMLFAPSSSESSIVTTLGVPMPTPGTSTAPHFKGKQVEDFLDSLKQHADSARVPHLQLPGYILRYCCMKVQIMIEGSNAWAGDDWVTAKMFLADLYSLNNSIPINSPDWLRQWRLKHGKSGIVLSRRDMDKYYREFTALSSGLAPSRMLENKISLCFYRGIPMVLHMKIKKQIPATNLKTLSPPSISSLLGWLRAEFDEEDLDAKIGLVSLDLDSDTDTSSSESDDDIDKILVKRKKKKPTKKVAFEKAVLAVPIVER